ncbi:uncharacterized protein SPAPADRAFT_68858 [Spathaspora passalidarum NRRL Y-27907]|uniref:SCP domain-containing protein n=1 Tax=Spathaspora passalidarum (strain NRRL Y-27907 / 11-Y1) TaxID=619300 RepID=G3AVX0_SPAPN|nr:uncharacterized protein SPAPADRAFT_68858 [Spathaspora passalidarum NRRL Y-27907]EGW30015.1 hypothetical protein SPAPADRAFT_68858 [Spathaspora passalidarum NRRL Y-27907]
MKLSAAITLAYLALFAQSVVLPDENAEAPIVAVAERSIEEEAGIVDIAERSVQEEADILAAAQNSVLQAMEGEVGSGELSKRLFGLSFDLGFSINILTFHNFKRILHGDPLLCWDHGLYRHAKHYIDRYDCSGDFHHPDGPYGSNWGIGSSKAFSVSADAGFVVDKWYGLGKSIGFGKSISLGAKVSLNSFTNLIWKSTRRVGCAYKDCRHRGRGYFYYCNYDPCANNPSYRVVQSNIPPRRNY